MSVVSMEEITRYYSSPRIQREMLRIAKNREVVGRDINDRFFKRPDIIQYPSDISERVRQGVASFHCSVERWSNPMALSSELKQEELDELRIGWDLIIDLDAKIKLEHARTAAICIVDFLKENGIAPTIKFSGRRGFHIAISKEAFPEEINFSFLSKRYPDVAKIIIRFIKEKTKNRILDELINLEGGIASLKKIAGTNEIDPYIFVDVEENWGNRHLFRMPYSLHMKTGKVSVPIRLFKLKSFKPEHADMDNIKISPFLENRKGEATELLLEALDWDAKVRKLETKTKIPKTKKSAVRIPEEFFPPCIKKLIGGISDGKKRSIFSLVTFLKSVNWPPEDIEKKVKEWNKNNERTGKSLPDRYIITQLRWHEKQSREILPANCDSELFWHSTKPKLCDPNHICETIKNPVNYAFKKFYATQKNKSIRNKKRNKKVDDR